MTAAPSVLAVGETMVLVAPVAAQPLETAVEFRLDIGGAESNVASQLAREGVAAAWAGAVGDDALGRRLLATLADRGVDTGWTRVDPDAPTGLYLKDPGPTGTRVAYYRRGSAASRLDAGFAATLPLDTVPWVHLSGITPALSDGCRDLVDAVLSRRAAAGLPVSFDVNHRRSLWADATSASELLLAFARRADLVFVGRDEAAALWGTVTAEDVRELVGNRGVLVVKDEDIAAHAFSGDRVDVVAPQPVEIVEPVGAGDAFAAGYLAATIAGAHPDAALRNGHRLAARALTSITDF